MTAIPEILDRIMMQIAHEETIAGGGHSLESPANILRMLLRDRAALSRIYPLIVARYRADVRGGVQLRTLVANPPARSISVTPRLRGLLPWTRR